MNKEQKAISLELAKELQKVAKENGFKLPESEMWWGNTIGQKDQTCWRLYTEEEKEIPDTAMEYYPAYDTSELGEIIPGNIEGLVFQTQKGMLGNLYYCMMIDSIGYVIRHQEEATTEAEVRGQMFSYLIKNKLT